MKINTEIEKVCKEDSKPKMKTLSLKDLKIDLIDYNKNPYKMMCNMALCTWGEYNNKWKDLSPETRFFIVKEVLEGRALPLALEVPTFNFSIENISRAAFDQIARARIGVVFSSKGFKDNDLNHLDYIIPTRIKDKELIQRINDYYVSGKLLYKKIQNNKVPNWAARCAVGLYASHRFMMSINFMSLQQMCSGRMQTSEMEDTVAFAWLLRERVKEVFPLLAEYLKPMCDKTRQDTTVKVNGFAEILGLPHDSDYRWKTDLSQYKILNKEPCTDIKQIEKDLKIKIPNPQNWKSYTWETLDKKDKLLFEEK